MGKPAILRRGQVKALRLERSFFPGKGECGGPVVRKVKEKKKSDRKIGRRTRGRPSSSAPQKRER